MDSNDYSTDDRTQVKNEAHFITATTNYMDNTGVETGFSASMLTFAAVMTFLIMIVGIFGNFLTVVALLKCPKVRNVAAAFIISLCLADLIFCALVLPFSALRFVQGTWTHGEVLCKLIPFIQYGNIGVSLLCIAMITINRYVMIAHHSSYGRIYKKHWIGIMIAFCWLFSYGMQLPTLLGVWGKFDYDPKLETCSIMSDVHGRSSKTTLFITAFVIPCLIIIACYTKIFWVVHKSEVRLKKHATKQNSIPNNLRTRPPKSSAGNGQQSRESANLPSDSSFSTDVKLPTVVAQKPSRIKDQREVRAKRNEWRITKMVLAIFLSFVICYLPITIAKVADKDVAHPGFHILSYIMLYLSACINPIIYVIMNKQYRKAYKTVIMCEPSKLLPFAKTVGGSSIAEKWKDTGLSNNHSRTMLSQMSALEQQNTSLSSSQPPTIVLEMTNKPTARDSLATKNRSNRMCSSENNSKLEVQDQRELQEQRVNSHQSERAATSMMMHANNTPPSTDTPKTSHPVHTPTSKEPSTRITLVGGDIILEEEEEPATSNPPAPPTPTTPTPQPTAIIKPEVASKPKLEITGRGIYANIGTPRKIPYYGQNINVIPDNSSFKLIPKQKI